MSNGSKHCNKIMCTSLHIFLKESVNLKKLNPNFDYTDFFIYNNSFYKNHKSQKL